MPSDKALTGAAGEHLVLSRLLSRDLLASAAPHKDSTMRRLRSEMPFQPEGRLFNYFEAWDGLNR